MAKKSDLLVLQEMAENNMDIASSTNLLSAEKVKQGGKVTFGINEKSLMDVMNNVSTPTHYAIVYIINKKEFDKIKLKEQ